MENVTSEQDSSDFLPRIFWEGGWSDMSSPINGLKEMSFFKRGYLVVEPTYLKNMLVKLDHLLGRGENKKVFETTTQVNRIISPYF